MRFFIAALTVVVVAASAVARSPCRTVEYGGDRFTACAYDPSTDRIAMAWRRPDGGALRGFTALKDMLGAIAVRVKFAVNAGMFHQNGAPVGLYVAGVEQDGRLNRRSGPGNFHMLPNGVFWIDAKGRARVQTSDAYARGRAKPVLATQSGPMLLIAGALHPRFQNDGPSRLIRNGVGQAANGAAIFVISETPVSFGKLARMFRDALGVRDALYLDGSVSSLWDPAQNRMDFRAPIGPVIWVY
jgi:uncharacterized protein YigE (DUF2233 family)